MAMQDSIGLNVEQMQGTKAAAWGGIEHMKKRKVLLMTPKRCLFGCGTG